MKPVAVGLAGAGPWAAGTLGPLLAAGPETALSAVWARRPEAAAALAGALGVPAAASYDELVEVSEAVALAVPPQAQPALAVRAASAGRALLLEKPLAGDVEGARRIAEAVGEAGVGSLVDLTARFAPAVRAWLDGVRGFEAFGARATFLSGALLGGAYARSPWRQEAGALLDVGPHVLDLVDAAAGEVVAVRAAVGDPQRWLSLVLEHTSGALSEVAISMRVGLAPAPRRNAIELYGPGGVRELDVTAVRDPALVAAGLRADLATVTREGAAAAAALGLDAARGLHLQRLIALVEERLAAG